MRGNKSGSKNHTEESPRTVTKVIRDSIYAELL